MRNNMENSTLTIKRKGSTVVPFSELKIGEIFKFEGCHEIYIKTEMMRLFNYKDVTRNAISLGDGESCIVDENWQVLRVKATLIEE